MPFIPKPVLWIPMNGDAKDYSGCDIAETVTGATLTTDYYKHPNSAYQFNGSSQKIAYGNVYNGVKSILIWIFLDSTTEYILDLDGGTTYIWANAGTVTATNVTSPTIYVDGIANTAVVKNRWHIIQVTTATGINANSVTLGNVGANWFDDSIAEVRLDSVTLTPTQIKYLHHITKKNAGGLI